MSRIAVAGVKAIRALDPFQKGSCPLCRRPNQNLVWLVEMRDGSRLDGVCLNCGSQLKQQLEEKKKIP